VFVECIEVQFGDVFVGDDDEATGGLFVGQKRWQLRPRRQSYNNNVGPISKSYIYGSRHWKVANGSAARTWDCWPRIRLCWQRFPPRVGAPPTPRTGAKIVK